MLQSPWNLWHLNCRSIKAGRRIATRLVCWPGCCGHKKNEEETVIVEDSYPRFLLWVDAVGGFLVCTGEQIALGQAVPGTTVDIPVFGDLSRRHAKIWREDGQYVIEPTQQVCLNGEKISKQALLTDGMEILLGANVELTFRKSHALSATARLDFKSSHRTQPSADAVLLMAESCVLGPRMKNHIVCQDWTQDVVLYRHADDLFCRASEPIEIDDCVHDRRGKVGWNSHVSGSEFALSLERV